MSESEPSGALWGVVGGVVGLVAGGVLGATAALFFVADQPTENGGPSQDGPGGPPPAMVNVGVAELRPLQDRVEVTGRLREVRRVDVTAEVEGKLVAVNVEEGDAVAGGRTVLARVDPVWATLQFAAAEAAVAETEAELQQSRFDLDQLTRLRRDGSAKQKEVDDATTLVAANEARLAAARADRNRANTRKDRLEVVAPFDARVTSKMAEVGQWVEAGDAIVQLVSTGPIDAEVDVPEHAVNAVEALADGDADVPVYVDALREEIMGRVVAVNPDGTSASRTFPVKVRLDNADGRLKPGMSVTARFPLGEPVPTLTVPRDAVLFSQLTPRVWSAMSEKDAPPEAMPAAVPVDVRVRFGADDRFAVEVLNGPLFPGAQVIVEGAESVFPGQPLMIGGADAHADTQNSEAANEAAPEQAATPDETADPEPT